MSGRAAFGPNLRRARIHQGISLETIAAETKVPIALWKGLEDNDLAGWPRGIYARAYVREYAELIGVDPADAVNEFCRLFPEGDRRLAGLLREHAEIVGHDLAWTDDLRGTPDRRAAGDAPPDAPNPLLTRAVAAFFDGCVVLGLASAAGLAVSLALATRLVVVTAAYYAVHVLVGGNTPALRLIDAALEHAASQEPLARRVRTLLRFGKRSEEPSRGMSS